MTAASPERRKEHNRAYYQKNREDRLRRNQEVRERNCQYIREIKEASPCTDCGVRYPWYVMDFDHLRDKTQDVGAMAYRNLVSLERLQEEVDKCEVVCANCHRIRTFTR